MSVQTKLRISGVQTNLRVCGSAQTINVQNRPFCVQTLQIQTRISSVQTKNIQTRLYSNQTVLKRTVQKYHAQTLKVQTSHVQTRLKSSVADRFSWLLAENNQTGVIDGLKSVYKTKLYPLEKLYGFHNFHSPSLADVDFDVLPQVLVIGKSLYN